jgi:hypothetical protein
MHQMINTSTSFKPVTATPLCQQQQQQQSAMGPPVLLMHCRLVLFTGFHPHHNQAAGAASA